MGTPHLAENVKNAFQREPLRSRFMLARALAGSTGRAVGFRGDAVFAFRVRGRRVACISVFRGAAGLATDELCAPGLVEGLSHSASGFVGLGAGISDPGIHRDSA